MARTICVANQKGGVGKTTTSVNLAAALTQLDRRVLIIDMDPQGNASSGLGVKRYENQANNVYQVLIGERTMLEAIQNTHVPGLDILPANPDLVGAEIELVEMPQREYRLKAAVQGIDDRYDYVLIDCPPSLGLLTVNSLSAAETFLVPLQCEYFALEGLSQLLNTAGLIKKSLNSELRIEGIVLTMFDARNNLSHQVVAEIQSHFSEKVFKAIIPRNVRLSEAPSHGQTIFQYDHRSIGAKRYLELATELDERVQRKNVPVRAEPSRVAPEAQSPASASPPSEPTAELMVVGMVSDIAVGKRGEDAVPSATADQAHEAETPMAAEPPAEPYAEATVERASAESNAEFAAHPPREAELLAEASAHLVPESPSGAEAIYTADAVELPEPFESATSDPGAADAPANDEVLLSPSLDAIHDANERAEPTTGEQDV